MSAYEVKTYKFECDKCKAVKLLRDIPHFVYPEGWVRTAESFDDEFGGVIVRQDLCNKCSKEKK